MASTDDSHVVDSNRDQLDEDDNFVDSFDNLADAHGAAVSQQETSEITDSWQAVLILNIFTYDLNYMMLTGKRNWPKP